MSYSKLTIPPKNKSNKYRKLYFIACCFPPFGRGNAITNSCVVNHLAEKFSVDVVCMKLKEGGLISYQEDESLKLGIKSNVKVQRVEGANWFGLQTALYIVGLFPCYFLNWAWQVWRQRTSFFSEGGIVFAVYPVFSDLVLGYLISRRYGFPFIVDFRDDFSGVMSSGWRRIFRPYYRFLERKIVRTAKGISVTTETLRNDLVNRYGLDPTTIRVVYNIVPKIKRPSNSSENRPEGKLSVIYAGAMSRVQKPEVLLKAYAQLLKGDPKWSERVLVEFYGPESPYFKLIIRKFFVEGCDFMGYYPHVEVAKRVIAADIGFFSLSDSIYSYATPTKLFDYIEAGVPIIASLPNGAAREIIESNEVGLVADVDDVEGLANCLREMVLDTGLRARCRANMLALRYRFSAEKQIENWTDMIVSLGLEKAINNEGKLPK